MFRLFKRLFSLVVVLVAIALILNLNISGRPAREHALEIWHNDTVQKVYQTVRDRFLAVIRKDISVEDAFKPDLSPASHAEKSEVLPGKTGTVQAAAPADSRVLKLENLSDDDRKALEKILQKSKGK